MATTLTLHASLGAGRPRAAAAVHFPSTEFGGGPPGLTRDTRKMVVVIGNPAAGASGRSVIRSAAAYLRRYVRRVEVGITRARGDAETLCREAVRAGAGMVVAAGGDGTINEVVNGLGSSGVTLGVIPLGTANVLAHETGIPTDPERACRLLLSGRPRAVHLGMAGARHFVLMAGAGFDAMVIYCITESLKKRPGKSAHIAAGLRSLIWARAPILTVTAPGMLPMTGTGIVVRKGRLEPRLEVRLFKGRGRIDWAGYAWGVLRGRHSLYDGVTLFETDRIQVTSEEKVHVHGDGDLFGTLPVNFSVAPYTLNVVLPEVRR
jgi:diacylglycerol kinase family enzyme